MEWFMPTPDGRTLAVEDARDPHGRPVMEHVSTPNSRHLYGRTVADATARVFMGVGAWAAPLTESTPELGR